MKPDSVPLQAGTTICTKMLSSPQIPYSLLFRLTWLISTYSILLEIIFPINYKAHFKSFYKELEYKLILDYKHILSSCGNISTWPKYVGVSTVIIISIIKRGYSF